MKKCISLFLALVLCVGLSVPALAVQTFTDVPSDHWARESIEYTVDKGLFKGTGANTFSPNTPMTRAMLIEVLFRYAGSPQLPDTWVFPYKDVADDAYYWDAAFWGRHRNIFVADIVEYSDTLNPDETVTRGEFAVMVCNFAREEMGSQAVQADKAAMDTLPFTDMELGMPGVDMDVRNSMLGWAYPNGIITGTSATTMSPNEPMTRAQAAAILMQYDQTFHGGQQEKPDQPDVDYTLSLGIMKSSLEVGSSTVAEAFTTPYSVKKDLTFTFTSSDTSVATIKTNASNKTGCTVTAVGPGTATIKVTDSNGITDEKTITVTGSSTVDPIPTPDTSDDEYADVAAELLERTNELRAEAGAAPLVMDATLTQVAQQRAAEIASREDGSYSVRPNGTYWRSALTEHGLDIYQMSFSESTGGWETLDADIFVDFIRNSFYSSATDSRYQIVGIGIAKSDDGIYSFSQIIADKIVYGNSEPKPVPEVPNSPVDGPYGDVQNEIIRLTNQVRAEYGIAPMSKSDLLMELAQQRAEECAQIQRIDHLRPNGESWYTILPEQKFDPFETAYTEVLGWSTELSARRMVNSWEGSPGHFSAMMSSAYTLVGVGAAKGSDGYYYCQIFTNKD